MCDQFGGGHTGGLQQQDAVGDLRVIRAGGCLRRGSRGLAGGGAGALVGGLDGTLQREVLVLTVIAAAARTSSALLALLACSAVFSTEDERAQDIPAELERARQNLAEALAEIDALPATAAAMFLGAVPGM
ncbi:hypothetical protein ACJ6WF_49250 [Streptomyces sp. MMS24-I2-30]|uniref:hypothetical protein n=1 Tax=Streptomyces sp. MMS24-I2-30 TaxID=3351564 RepID=UPI00389696F0